MGDFEIHKLTIETLGEYLTAVRHDSGHSQGAVAASIGVPLKVLAALEVGDWRALPEAVYVVGFIRKLAAFYNVAHEPLVTQFYREAGIARQQAAMVHNKAWHVLAAHLVPTRWALVGSIALGAIFVFVCFWQIFAIGTVPKLTVQTPSTGSKQPSGLVTVAGLATPGSEVAVNGQTVYAGSDGTFSSSVSFLPGPQSVVVSAKSRFGKVATKTVLFLVEGSSTGQVPVGPARPSDLGVLSTQAVVPLYADNNSNVQSVRTTHVVK